MYIPNYRHTLTSLCIHNEFITNYRHTLNSLSIHRKCIPNYRHTLTSLSTHMVYIPNDSSQVQFTVRPNPQMYKLGSDGTTTVNERMQILL